MLEFFKWFSEIKVVKIINEVFGTVLTEMYLKSFSALKVMYEKKIVNEFHNP